MHSTDSQPGEDYRTLWQTANRINWTIQDLMGGDKRLRVVLTTLHIEWMTQRHYLESVRDDSEAKFPGMVNSDPGLSADG